MRWTLDEKEDLDLISRIFKKLYPLNKLFGMDDILDLFEENKDLQNINKMHLREEGYRKSLKNDYLINED